MRDEGPSPVAVIGVPACTARIFFDNFVKILLLLLSENIPAGGTATRRSRGAIPCQSLGTTRVPVFPEVMIASITWMVFRACWAVTGGAVPVSSAART